MSTVAGFVLGIGILVGGLILIGIVAERFESPDSKKLRAMDLELHSAEGMARQFVERQLKAPATAKFSNTQSESAGEGSYVVTGSVDSQNSFGALLRSGYRVKLTPVGGDVWRPDEVKLFPQ